MIATLMLPDRDAASGGSVVMYGQVTAAAACHHVTLVAFAHGNASDGRALDALQARGIEVHTVPLPAKRLRHVARELILGKLPRRTLQFHDSAMQRLIDHLLRERQFDLVHVEDNAMGDYPYKTHAPMVLTEHEVRAFPNQGPSTIRADETFLDAADRRRWQAYQPAVWQKFDRIQVFTARDAAEIVRVAPSLQERVRVNPFGVDVPSVPNPEKEEKDHVVFVGNFLHAPNVHAAQWLGTEIMPALRALRSTTRLSIVGPYPPRSVRSLACSDTTITGSVPSADVFLERAAVVLAPLQTGGGMRVKVLHGMALGKAMVATPLAVEGLSFDAAPPAVRVASTTQEFASAISSLLADSDDRRELGLRARAFVAEHHSWSGYSARLEALYAELKYGSHRV